MTSELQRYEPHGRFESALKEAAQQAATGAGLAFLLNLVLSSTPSDERLRESLQVGVRQGLAQFCYRVGDYFSNGV